VAAEAEPVGADEAAEGRAARSDSTLARNAVPFLELERAAGAQSSRGGKWLLVPVGSSFKAVPDPAAAITRATRRMREESPGDFRFGHAIGDGDAAVGGCGGLQLRRVGEGDREEQRK
jgi:hypothetical protein